MQGIGLVEIRSMPKNNYVRSNKEGVTPFSPDF